MGDKKPYENINCPFALVYTFCSVLAVGYRTVFSIHSCMDNPDPF